MNLILAVNENDFRLKFVSARPPEWAFMVTSMIRALLLMVVALAAHAQQALPQRLQISVRFEDAFDAQGRANERVDQRVQVLEGRRATILTGESRPTRQRQYIQTPAGPIPQEVVVVQERTSGFEVVPRVSGNMVTMEIASANTVQTASGRLGEWFELGAIGARRVWAKVETLDR